MRIWRCENKQKDGPYSSMYLHMQPPWLQAHQFDSYRVRPTWDGIPSMKGYHSGFASFELLDKWFDKSNREELRTMGFHFYEMECPDNEVKLGNVQCAFVRDAATIIKECLA